MSKSTLFWILMLAWLILGAWPHCQGAPVSWNSIGSAFFAWGSVALLGWKIFDRPIKD